MKLSDLKDDELIKGSFTGEPGVGKSSAAASFPQPIYVFDFEQRMRSVVPYCKMLGIPMDGIEIDHYTAWRDVQAKMRMLETSCPYKTIVFDSLTSMADTILNSVGQLKGASKETVKMVGGIQVPSIEDYNAESGGIMEFIRFLKIVKAHVILNAHVLVVETVDIQSKRVTVLRSMLTGGKKVAAKIPAYMDYVFNFSVVPSIDTSKPPSRICYTQVNGVDFAKSSSILPYKIDWTNKNFFQVLKENWGKVTE